MYDALLGGTHNFEIDRVTAARAVAMVPDLPQVALSNRAFLRRAIRCLVDLGIRQFLDIGSGIPTVGNTHEIARQANPDCRVTYVDIDPVAVAHTEAILAGDSQVCVVRGDLRAPEQLLLELARRRVIDFSEPVGVLLVAVLHLLADADQPAKAVRVLSDAAAPGSHIAISHLSGAHRPDDAAKLAANSAQRAGPKIIFRSREEIMTFFHGLTMIEPGVVELAQWRVESPADVTEPQGRSLGLAGVGRKE